MIKLLCFTNKFRCFLPGDAVDFRPGVNLLVGDQGSGKSTILQSIAAHAKLKKFHYTHGIEKNSEVAFTNGTVGGMDFERDNMRTQSYFGDNMQMQLSAMFSSHGQTNIAILRALTKASGNATILLDEPDMALSVRSIVEVVKILVQAASNGTQIVASCHNPFLIRAFPVYSCEHRSWMHGEEFINTQTQPIEATT